MFEAFETNIRNPMSNINNIVDASYNSMTGGKAIESLASRFCRSILACLKFLMLNCRIPPKNIIEAPNMPIFRQSLGTTLQES